MPCVDRTQDFFDIVERVRASSNVAFNKPVQAARNSAAETQFNAMAGEIGKEIHTVQMNLAELAKRTCSCLRGTSGSSTVFDMCGRMSCSGEATGFV